MLPCKGLILQIKRLEYSGFLPTNKTRQNPSKELQSEKRRIIIALVFIFTNGLLTASTIICAIKPITYESYGNNYTSFAFDYLIFLSTGLVHIAINMFLFFNKNFNLTIVEKVLCWKRKYPLKHKVNDSTVNLFLLNIVILIICYSNIIVLVWYTDDDVSAISISSRCVVYVAEVYYDGLISTFYRSLVCVIEDIFTSMNERIEFILNSNNELFDIVVIREILQDRQEIVRLCEKDLSGFYGVPIILLAIPTLLHAANEPFYIMTAWDKSNYSLDRSFVVLVNACIIWGIPWYVCFVMLYNQNAEEEANKTARILSRISRRGNGMEKMVDKFLIKNMQQKPILTAYGFFPLNKRTLFKIFAAIFTYMVILIQFKDMENTSKLLAETKTSTEVS
ncbi:gustatory and pheromone receptor 39a-like isoform X1 [Eupeodes corollae]|uniref:gustatory and pheromone receptor 39a-like isoform X1 n=1 Tax=Eupeodes corollae TaxID=290404 RepID=UPI00248F6356|nr:gustatory and pheromone receptor 39a-like isoform X1 [Eupeodes corollae]